MMFLGFFIFSFLLSVSLTKIVARIATSVGVVDHPTQEPKKIHRKPIPLLGGIGMILSIAMVLLFVLYGSDSTILTGGEITSRHYIGFIIASLILLFAGVMDDVYNLKARQQIIAPIFAALTAIAFGIEIDKRTNPFGGVIELQAWQSNIIVFVWLMVVMYTTKFLDGLDGLSTGVSAIGTFMVLCLALTTAYFQPDVATFATICLGALLGFLLFNIHPAKIFLGEGGSTFVGFVVGILAVISGGKFATALLVIAIPLLDVVWIIIRRFRAGGIRQIFIGDRKHLHHRLFDRGWSQRQIVTAYYLVAIVFGLSALFLQSKEKIIALAALVAGMIIVAIVLSKQEKSV